MCSRNVCRNEKSCLKEHQTILCQGLIKVYPDDLIAWKSSKREFSDYLKIDEEGNDEMPTDTKLNDLKDGEQTI